MFKYEYLWIVVLVLFFETVALIPFKKHLRNEGESIFACVACGNFAGIFLGTAGLSILGFILGSFLQFIGVIGYREIMINFAEYGIIISSFIGYGAMIVSEWD
jgi:hypothetical protein